MSTVYRDGSASVTLTGDLEAWALDMVRRATAGASDEIRATLEGVARDAEAKWYGAQGVKRQSGRSGDLTVTTTITPRAVRFTVGSTDTRRAGRTVVASFVHRPGGRVHPERGDGKRLLLVFVQQPAKLAISGAAAAISAEMARRAGGAHG